MAFKIGKKISELSAIDSLKMDDLLVVSWKEDGVFYSKKINVKDFKNDIKSKLKTDLSVYFTELSSDLSTYRDELSDQYNVYCRDISSDMIDTRTEIHNYSLSAKDVLTDLSTTSKDIIKPLKYVMGLSTLNHFTYIGSDIKDFKPQDVFGDTLGQAELEKLSSEILFFQLSGDDTFIDAPDISKLNDLQYQVYRLGLQVKNLEKINSIGVIPGTVDNSVKDNLLQIAEDFEVPEELVSTGKLTSVGIYGDVNVKNNSKYYTIFSPAGFQYDSTFTHINWQIKDHDDGDNLTKTYTLHKDGEASYYNLKVQLNPFNNESTTSCLVYQIQMKASIENNNRSQVWRTDNTTINNVISKLSADNLIDIRFRIDTDIENEKGAYVMMDSDFYGTLSHSDGTDVETYSLQIVGSDYCDEYNYYYSKFNNDTATLPFTTDVTWSLVKRELVTVEETTVEALQKYKSVDLTFLSDEVELTSTVSIVNQHDNACFLDFDEYKDQLADRTLSLMVESNYDPTLSAIRGIKIGGLEIDTNNVEPTVPAVCAKLDTAEHFLDKITTLYKGELLYITDEDKLAIYNGSSIVRTGSGSGSSGSSSQALTLSQLSVINNMALDHLTFKKSGDTDQYTLDIATDGKIKVLKDPMSTTEVCTVDTSDDMNVYVSHLLQISKVFCGGTNSGYSDCLVSHNFVELTNSSENDINLNGMMLMYYTSQTHTWEYIKLKGVIKAGGTFLIRGAECNKGKNAVIKVDTCDLEWRCKSVSDGDGILDTDKPYSRTGNLISFNQTMSMFYLMMNGTNDKGKTAFELVMATDQGMNIWGSTSKPSMLGYIDLVVFSKDSGDTSYAEGNKLLDLTGKDFNNLLFEKWFYMDPSKQGNKAYKKRTTKSMWTYIDLSKQDEYNGNCVQYYYSDDRKLLNKPHSSSENATFFSNKTTFNKNRPNAINVLFGRQATYNDSVTPNIKASRCFNWVSVGYYNEFLNYRRVKDESGASVTDSWKTVRSITQSDHADYIEPFHKFYDRIRWTASDGTFVTTHKVVLHNVLDAGTYEYYVSRENDSSYKSDTNTFKVKSNSNVGTFSFIQVTDQQGFNWQEYQAWKQTCYMINKEEGDTFNFTINTGDIAQSGNRANEWLDYYDGRQFISDKEEMFTIGNNDLCGSKDYNLTDGNDNTSKFNLINVLKYYTFELDENNYTDGAYEQIQRFRTPIGTEVPEYIYDSSISGYRLTEEGETATHVMYYETNKVDGSTYTGKIYTYNTGSGNYEHKITNYNRTVDSDGNVQFTLAGTDDGGQYYYDTQMKCYKIPYKMYNYFGDIFGNKYPIYSVYSFNYGKWHFVSLTSEIRALYYMAFEGTSEDRRFSNTLNATAIRWFKKDLDLFKPGATNYSDCIVYMHEMPFTIVTSTYDSTTSKPRGDYSDPDSTGCKLNIEVGNINSDGSIDPLNRNDFMISRLFKKLGIRLVMGGHKHTFAISKPIYDAPDLTDYSTGNHITNSEFLSEDEFINGEVTAALSRQPVIEVKTENSTEINTLTNFKILDSTQHRFIQVDKITAPTYVMCQSSGYKLVSNKEMPSPNMTPWLLSYFPINSDGTENCYQHRPMYIKYTLTATDTDKNIKLVAKQIDGIYSVKSKSSQGYDFNSQGTTLKVVPMTFGYFPSENPVITSASEQDKFKPTVSSMCSSYNDMIDGNTYTLSCDF